MEVQKNWDQAALWETGGRQIDITLYYTLSLHYPNNLTFQPKLSSWQSFVDLIYHCELALMAPSNISPFVFHN